jgi:hypothetical protein
MLITRGHFALRPLAIILAVMMFAFGTVADAATCGSEVGLGGGLEVASVVYEAEAHGSANRDGSKAPAEQHGLCAHGHCHHGSNCERGAVGAERAAQTALHEPAAHPVLSSVNRDILSPPPRA